MLEVVELLEGELGADARANGTVWTDAVEAVKSVLGGTYDWVSRAGSSGIATGMHRFPADR